MEDLRQLRLPFPKPLYSHIKYERCNHLPPWEEPNLVDRHLASTPCLLHQDHEGEHLLQREDGQFFLWITEFRLDLESDGEDPEDDLELIFGETTSAHAARLLARSPVMAQKSLSTR